MKVIIVVGLAVIYFIIAAIGANIENKLILFIFQMLNIAGFLGTVLHLTGKIEE